MSGSGINLPLAKAGGKDERLVRIKVCGITNLEDAQAAIAYGADALGFVLAESPRQMTPEQVRHIVAQLPPFVCKVGVFVDSELEKVRDIMSTCALDIAQLHGSESPQYCQALFPRVIKSFRVGDKAVIGLIPQYRASAYLLDTYDAAQKGGAGRSFDWNIAREAKRYGPIILAGGLTPDNVSQAISVVQPYAVDVSSGVEIRPGKKDPDRLRAFINAVKQGGFP